MKILTVNRNYFMTGGPEKYMFSLMENMPQHLFIPFCVDFEQNIDTPYRKYFVTTPAGSGSVYYKDFKMSYAQKAAYAIDSIYHWEARGKLEQLIRDERPDVALFLNAVYFSDSIIDACRKYNIPIIWRISDFHKVCASYLLYRDGQVCEECLDHGLTRAIKNRCGGYQRSIGAAVIKVAGMWLSCLRSLYDSVSFFITPSSFTRDIMIRGGFSPEKIIHIPTWVALPKTASEPVSGVPKILYVGRLSYEKGVETLLQAFSMLRIQDACLTIIGDNTTPYAMQLEEAVPSHLKNRIEFTGFLKQADIATHFKNSTCFVVPSVCYENQPNVLLEGMSHALPAVVSDHGSMREIMANGETGYLFEAGNTHELAGRLDDLLNNADKALQMGKQARDYVLRNHSLQRHLSALEELFMRCVKGNEKVAVCPSGREQ